MCTGGPQHDYLLLTGGAIGIGIPLSVGAAVACPDRKVVGMQADGPGMYTVQGLWTLARENLDIVTVVFANRTYAILHGEMRAVGVNDFGRNARLMLNLDEPALGLGVAMAQGMGVEAGAGAPRRRSSSSCSKAALSPEGAVPDRGGDLRRQYPVHSAVALRDGYSFDAVAFSVPSYNEPDRRR